MPVVFEAGTLRKPFILYMTSSCFGHGRDGLQEGERQVREYQKAILCKLFRWSVHLHDGQ
jgi:hypothetical protein